MVRKVEKFVCGCGIRVLYECEVCGSLFFSKEDAEKCEASHDPKPKRD